jgi:predicted N-formylglutamate amidohydrolase
VLGGIARPWDIGILHDGGDAGFARLLLARLGEEKGIVVGDNVPYQMDDTDHSVPRHAYASRLPYAELEIRQDRIGDGEGQDRWTALLAAALNDAQARMEGDGYGR